MSGNYISNKKHMQLIADLSKRTKFQKPEIEALLNKFKEITKTKMDRTKFRDILHGCFKITDDVIMDRVFKAFDKDNDSFISAEEWVRGLSIFLRGADDEKMKFCFNVYDMNGDGYISRDEMFHMLKSSLIKQTTEEDPDEGVKDLVEITLKKMDLDHDSRLSYKDFEESVKCDGLLLEVFGQCLPDHKSIINFETMFFADPSIDQQLFI